MSTEFDAFREAARSPDSSARVASLARPSDRRVEFTMAVPASNVEETPANRVADGGNARERSRPVLI
ncbi:MAG TPA: hypothetical protein VFV00_10820, partial [Acidimicrobiales bacterium]|nr:hypothetical protein [Acidimicrobiales bacterium]